MGNNLMKKLIIDLQTGERTELDFSEKEILNAEKSVKEFQALQLAEEKVKIARQSGLDKLAALGLSAKEIAAITGA